MTARNEFSQEELEAMIAEKGFYDGYRNASGQCIKHEYDARTINGDKIVMDQTTGLMWQQSGSDNEMFYKSAQDYIADLNIKKFAGFSDWRLPTTEEAMSLMENSNNNENHIYIHPIFDGKQDRILTVDFVTRTAGSWMVDFYASHCHLGEAYNSGAYVRAVRSEITR